MASTARAENHIEKEVIEAYLDRFEGMEDEAQSIMMAANEKVQRRSALRAEGPPR